MMRNQQRQADPARTRREILKPTLFPRKLHFWSKDYEMEANAKYGDASIFVFTNVRPKYSENDFNVYIRTKLELRTNAALAAFDP